MFQLNSCDKTEWNFKENRIIIPLMDVVSLPKEPDKIVENVNLIPDDGDLTNPTGNLEQSLVIGLDKNLFEPQNTKTDLLIIQDSDLKLLSCNPDLKNHLGYSLSVVNQNKNENSGLKHKLKNWPHDNSILEVKDILIYNEKIDENIDLNYMETKPESCVTKLQDIKRKEVIESESEKNFQLIINYIPKSYNILPKGETENCEILVDNQNNNENENSLKKVVCDNDVSLSTNNFINFKAEVNARKIPDVEEKNDTVPEKSLPLKKKAKMKKTMICYDNQRSLLKEELIKNRQSEDKSSSGSKDGVLQPSFAQEDCNVSDFEKSLIGKINKRKKTQRTSPKLKKMAAASPVQENKQEQPITEFTDSVGFDIRKFKNIFDLVEGLRKYRMISVPVWQMLNTGLKEMNVDILKEIIKKQKEPGGRNYSPQLKAFALVVYFKQPVAFNFLAKVCKEGWPSLNVIKEWKLQLNSHQRSNFVGVERKT